MKSSFEKIFLSLLLLLFVTHCSGADVTSTGTATIENDNDFDINEGEAPDYDADADESGTGEGSTSGGDSGSGSTTGDASEDCAYQDVEASPKDIVFSLGQLNPPDAEDSSRYECQTVSISGCYPFKAEIISTETDPNIVIADSEGSISSAGLVEGEESFQVCCTHHTGRMDEKAQVNVYVGESSVDYVFVIEAECDTLDSELITLNTPTEGQYVWEGTSTETDINGLDFFPIDVAGTINIGTTPELKDILVKDSNGMVKVKFNIADQIQNWSFDPDSYGEGTDVTFSTTGFIPSDLPDIYNVSISLETTLGTFTESVDVIRLTEPELSVSLQDYNGNVLSATTETPDTTNYYKVVSGIEVGNVELIGEDTQLSLYVVKPDGTVSAIFENEPYYEGFTYGTSVGEDGKCPGTFANGDSSYCSEYLPLTVFGTGLNTIVAKACNTYTNATYRSEHDDYTGIVSEGCILAETYVVTDTSLPQTTCSDPVEGQIFYDGDEVVLTCTLENFAKTISVTDPETGVTTDECNVKLFFNSINLDGTEDKVGEYTELCDDLNIVANEDGSTTNANTGNIRKATFEYTLPKNKMLKYNNFIQVVTKDTIGNQNYFSRSFIVTKDFNKFTKSYRYDQLTTKALGKVDNTSASGKTIGSPIMIKISEETLTNEKIIPVLQKVLNDNVDFIIMGIMGGDYIDQNGDDEITVEEDFDDYISTFLDMSMDQKELFVTRLLQKPTPYKVIALSLYRYYIAEDSHAYFSDKEEDGEIAALDASGQPITLATVPLNALQYIRFRMDPDKFDQEDEYGLAEWPDSVCNNLGLENVGDCNTLEQGIWDISLDLKDNGFIDATLILKGKKNDNPDIDVEYLPALAGHTVVYPLVEEGSTGAYTIPQKIKDAFTTIGIPDPTVPLYFNMGKLTIILKDSVRLFKAQKGSDNKVKMEEDSSTGELLPVKCENPDKDTDGNGGCSLYLYIYPDRIRNLSNEHYADNKIIMDPYTECGSYFKSRFPESSLPWGCYDGTDYPLNVDINSNIGYDLWADEDVGNRGGNNSFLFLFNTTLENVVRYTLTGLPAQVNPILDSKMTPYPDWVPEEDKIDELAFALGTPKESDDAGTTFEINDNISFGMEDDIEDPLFRFKLNLAESDLEIYDGGITIKLLIDYLGANVDLSFASSSTMRSSGSFTGSIPASITPHALGEFVKVLTRKDGFPYWSPEDASHFENIHPSLDADASTYDASLGISLGLEPLGNAALALMINQGFEKLLNAFDVGNIELVDAHTLRINRVSLSKIGRDDYTKEGGVCGIKPISTDFSTDILIGDFAFLFASDGMNLDIRLKNPPTLAVTEYDDGDATTTDDSEYTELQIGIPDLEIDFRDMTSVKNEDTGNITYQVGDIIFTGRLDLILRVALKYEKPSNGSRARLSIFLLPLEKQIIVTDVIKQGASSGIGLDEGGFIKTIHEQLLKFFWEKLGATPGNNPTFAITLPNKITDYDKESVTVKTDDMATGDYDDYPGMVIENNTKLDPNDECSSCEVYFYTDDEDTLPAECQPEDSSSHGGSGSFPNPGHMGGGSGGGSTTGGSGSSPRPGGSGFVDPPEDFDPLDLDNPCNWVAADLSTTINEALCELGIDEVHPYPDISFSDGYVHLSISATVKIYNWLTSEVNGDLNEEDQEDELKDEKRQAQKDYWEEKREEEEEE